MSSMYMRMPGIPGDATDADFVGFIEVQYVRFMTTAAAPPPAKGRLPKGRTRPEPTITFEVQFNIGPSVPLLHRHLTTDTPIEHVDFIAVRPAGDGSSTPERYWHAEFTAAKIAAMKYVSPDGVHPAATNSPDFVRCTFRANKLTEKLGMGTAMRLSQEDAWTK